MNYFMSNRVSYPELMKEPMELWAMALGNIVLGILLVYTLKLGGIHSANHGAGIGAFVFFLLEPGIKLMM